MSEHPLRALGRSSLIGLAQALKSGRAAHPYGGGVLATYVPDEQIARVHKALDALNTAGMSGAHIATMLELLAEERQAQQLMSDRVELVLSPPELDRVDARDTAVVVQDLFRRAKSSVLIASFALDTGAKARHLFGELAQRMDAEEHLSVRLFANIHRAHQDATPASTLVREFAERFRTQLWPGSRLPKVFFDPRSVALSPHQRAVFHAKCVVIDETSSLVTSANFTEAAQARNIEAGLVIHDQRLAQRMTRQFDELLSRQQLIAVPGLS